MPLSESDGMPLGQPEPDETSSIRKESILTGCIRDEEAKIDCLGFAPYVEAVARFLTSRATQTPLSMSIEGEWGSGKSSFMRQLSEFIEDSEPSLPRNRRPVVVWFNPWRHDKQEALWAAFALEFLRQVQEELGLLKRHWCGLRLFWIRYKWKSALPIVVHRLVWAFGAFALVMVFSTSFRNELPSWITPVLPLLPFLGVAVEAFVKATNPFKADLQRFLACPRYEDSVSFVEAFHRDFQSILSVYAPGRRVYVFIDDLDRCEVPRAAELMQAINLLVSANHPPIAFVIGMDWDKVAAGIAVKNEALSRHLIADGGSRFGGNQTQGEAMEFGRAFIEKFVQLRFKVPLPSSEDLKRLLESLSRSSGESTGPGDRKGRGAPPPPGNRWSDEGELRDSVGTTEGPRPPFALGTKADSHLVQEIALRLMPAFENNPRRLKQFLSLYRLRIYIAYSTGMLSAPVGESSDKKLSFEQLGKFTAIELGWPGFLRAAQSDEGLLCRVEKWVSGAAPLVGEDWLKVRGLTEVLGIGLKDEADRQRWSLAGVDFSSLLRVSPFVVKVETEVAVPPSAPKRRLGPPVWVPGPTAEQWCERGRAARDPGEKFDCFTRAIELKPDFALAYLLRGNLRHEQGDFVGAVEDYSRVIELRPGDAHAFFNRGLAHADRNDPDHAVRDYTESIRLDPGGADALVNRGIVHAKVGNLEAAADDFTAALHRRSDDADGYYNRAKAFHRKGVLAGALRDYDAALRINPNDLDAAENRAIVVRDLMIDRSKGDH